MSERGSGFRVVVAPDKFRGSLSASAAAAALARGVRRAASGAEVVEVPMADGGEGTVDALVNADGGQKLRARVTGPLGAPIDAEFGRLTDGVTYVIEMATASGLALLSAENRDPAGATTRGTGELLAAALDAGARRVIMGIGGSATNDGGAGMAQALGYRLLDLHGNEIGPGGGGLEQLERIEPRGRDLRLDAIEILVACDVDNPLCGPRGASFVYGPQKGATPEVAGRLDRALARFAEIVQRDLGIAVAELPGAGAAGGLGGGLVAFAGAKLRPGAPLLIETVRLADRLRGADLCLTGEGLLDGSSTHGKTAVAVARLARGLAVPTFVLAGSIGAGAERVLDEGVDAYFSLCPGPTTLENAYEHASEWLEILAEQVARAFQAGRLR